MHITASLAKHEVRWKRACAEEEHLVMKGSLGSATQEQSFALAILVLARSVVSSEYCLTEYI